MAGRRDTLTNCNQGISVLCVHVAVHPIDTLITLHSVNLIRVLDLGYVSATRIAEQLFISGGS